MADTLITLGRSGLPEGAYDEMTRKIGYLDALLCVLSGSEVGEDGLTELQRFNPTIQQVALDLASSLAQDVHELHHRLLVEDMERRRLASVA